MAIRDPGISVASRPRDRPATWLSCQSESGQNPNLGPAQSMCSLPAQSDDTARHVVECCPPATRAHLLPRVYSAAAPISRDVEGTWDAAYALANATVANLTLAEKTGCWRAWVQLAHSVTAPRGYQRHRDVQPPPHAGKGVAMAEEFRAKGTHFGPDPYLSGEGAFATLTGVQNVGVQACAKHLVANNQEHWRYGLDAYIDDRTMHETYFDPSIEAGVISMMLRRERLRRDARLVFGTGGGSLASAVSGGDVATARLNQMAARVLAGASPQRTSTRSTPTAPERQGERALRGAHGARARDRRALRRLAQEQPHGGTAAKACGLPLSAAQMKTLAVVGKDALLPNLGCNDLNTCNDGMMVTGWGPSSNLLLFTVPPITAIQDFVGTSVTDGRRAGLLRRRGGNMGDRSDLDLWTKGGSLVEAVAAMSNNTITIIHSVRLARRASRLGPRSWTCCGGEPKRAAALQHRRGHHTVVRVWLRALVHQLRVLRAQDHVPERGLHFGSTSGVTVSFTVAGTEIPQLYLAFPADARALWRVLRGFDEVHMECDDPGSAGTFTVTVGASIKDVRLTGMF
ncbi:beta-glucosidase [Mycena latifolia]|nr:beta-glucosidase [Mycena latifolia]